MEPAVGVEPTTT